MRYLAAVCFGLWVAIGSQVSADASLTMLFGKGVQVPVSECRAADRRTNKMIFPHDTSPQSHFILVDQYLYQVTFGKTSSKGSKFGITCFKSEMLN